MKVSPRNLYAMLCYAWDVLELAGQAPVGVDEAVVPAELLARVLVREVDALLKRGLVRRYREEAEDLRRPRGAIDVSSTLARGLTAQRRVACVFEELTPDVPENRLLVAGLRRAVRLRGVTGGTRRRLRRALRRFPPVADIVPTEGAFASVRLHRQTARYRQALHVARLLCLQAVPAATGDGLVFDDFTGDEQRMGTLFERFVYRFLEHEQADFRVAAPQLAFVADGPKDDLAMVPVQRTDVVLTGRRPASGAWVLECKCVTRPYVGHYGSKKLHSGHLYQLLSYLQTRAAHGTPTRGGVLLYAEAAAGPMAHDLVLNGHSVRVRSVPLQAPWPELRESLLGLAAELAVAPASAVA